jgi:hypothetical protein
MLMEGCGRTVRHWLQFTEAVHFLDIPLGAIDLLGVGTLSEPASFVHGGKSGWFGLKPGLIQWAPQLLGLMFRGQMETSWAIASLERREATLVRHLRRPSRLE